VSRLFPAAILAALALAMAATPALAQATLPLTVQTAPGTPWAIKCHVRTYTTKEGAIANTYTVVNKGPFRDVIPSSNAQCQFWKTGGAGPVTLHIAKGGDHAVTATDVGKPVSLQVW